MGRVVHFEIHAEEPERAVKFYSELFGWTFTKWDGPMPYWLISTGPKESPGIDGGLMKRMGPAPTPGQPMNGYPCTIDVPSVDEAVANATALGATIAVPKMPILGVGWLAYLVDTEGNIFGVHTQDSSAK